jgi:hypothetical protein
MGKQKRTQQAKPPSPVIKTEWVNQNKSNVGRPTVIKHARVNSARYETESRSPKRWPQAKHV